MPDKFPQGYWTAVLQTATELIDADKAHGDEAFKLARNIVDTPLLNMESQHAV